MSVVIEDHETTALVALLVETTGESAERALAVAVQERLERLHHRKGATMLELIRPTLAEIDALPHLDARSAEEIIGYNEQGHFD